MTETPSVPPSGDPTGESIGNPSGSENGQVAAPPADASHQTIDTANKDLADGLNRCPACGSTDVQLRASSSKLMCLFCRHEWSEGKIDDIVGGSDGIDELQGTHVASGAANIAADAADVVTLKCGGCGSDVVVNVDETTSARCHWCRHVLTINEQVPNGAVPDAVLPFSYTRDQAVKAITEFAGKRKMFADRKFLADFKPGNVVGVYLPYMVVDSNVSAKITGQGEILTNTYREKRGDDEVVYYDADVYQVDRHIDFIVDDLIIESSDERADMNTLVNTNNVINAILPFDTKEAVQWNANYLAGFTSEKRDKDVEAVKPVLENQLLSIARSEIYDSTSRYDRGVRWETEDLDLHGSRWVSMYMPVWLYSYYHEKKGKGMVHYIAVNGRTGATMGSIPVSHWRLLFAAIFAGTIVEGIAIAILGALS